MTSVADNVNDEIDEEGARHTLIRPSSRPTRRRRAFVNINREVYRIGERLTRVGEPIASEFTRHENPRVSGKGDSRKARYGGEVAFTATEAGEIARRFGTCVVVVKAQIRGRPRRRRRCEVTRRGGKSRTMIGRRSVKLNRAVVGRVLIEALQMQRELYLMLLDRAAGASDGLRRRRHGHQRSPRRRRRRSSASTSAGRQHRPC